MNNVNTVAKPEVKPEIEGKELRANFTADFNAAFNRAVVAKGTMQESIQACLVLVEQFCVAAPTASVLPQLQRIVNLSSHQSVRLAEVITDHWSVDIKSGKLEQRKSNKGKLLPVTLKRKRPTFPAKYWKIELPAKQDKQSKKLASMADAVEQLAKQVRNAQIKVIKQVIDSELLTDSDKIAEKLGVTVALVDTVKSKD